MAKAEMKIQLDVAGVAVVRPGDTLIVGIRQQVTVQQAERYKAQLAQRLPGVRLVVLAEVAGLAVYVPNDIAVQEDGATHHKEN